MIQDLNKFDSCLAEIRKRIDILGHFISGGRATGSTKTDVEFICLQFRIVVELISLSSLSANEKEYNEYVEQFENFGKGLKLQKIFRGLKSRNPEFYPKPRKLVKKINSTGEVFNDIEKIDTPYFSEDRANQVWLDCSKFLHANRSLGVSLQGLEKMYQEFSIWIKELTALSDNYSVILLDNRIVIISDSNSKGLNILLKRGEVY